MRFFADHCVPEAVAERLEAEGHEVLRLRDELPPDAPDEVVIEAAQERQAVLLSLNGNFADIVNYPPQAYGGIVALQVRNRPEALEQILDPVLGRASRSAASAEQVAADRGAPSLYPVAAL